MKISVTHIGPKGMDFQKRMDPHEIGLLHEDVNTLKALDLSGHIEKILNSVTARVQVETRIEYECDRCLDHYAKDVNFNFTFNYMIEPNTQFVDLGEDLRQEIMLNLSQKHLCQEDCRGICPECGKNLNEGMCKCPVQSKSTQTNITVKE